MALLNVGLALIFQSGYSGRQGPSTTMVLFIVLIVVAVILYLRDQTKNKTQGPRAGVSENDIREIVKLFYDPNEKFVAMIGEDYITSFLHGDFAKSIVILSDKRVYQRGKVFERQANGRFISVQGSKDVLVKDITGTSFSETNLVPLLILGVMFSLGALAYSRDSFMGPLTMIVSIFCIGFYFLGRRRMFRIDYPGGAIGTDARWYNQEQLQDFQKHISLIKERISS